MKSLEILTIGVPQGRDPVETNAVTTFETPGQLGEFAVLSRIDERAAPPFGDVAVVAQDLTANPRDPLRRLIGPGVGTGPEPGKHLEKRAGSQIVADEVLAGDGPVVVGRWRHSTSLVATVRRARDPTARPPWTGGPDERAGAFLASIDGGPGHFLSLSDPR